MDMCPIPWAVVLTRDVKWLEQMIEFLLEHAVDALTPALKASRLPAHPAGMVAKQLSLQCSLRKKRDELAAITPS